MWNSNAGFGGFGANDNSASASKNAGPGGGFFSPGGAPNESQTDKKGRSDAAKTVCPVTIGKIHQVPHTEDNVTIAGVKSGMVTVCGLVVSMEETSNKIHFKVYDMTGPPVMCQYWISNPNGSDKVIDVRSDIVENAYIRVTGALRIIEDTRVLLAFNVKRITDYNEVTVHMLEIIHTNIAMSVVVPEGNDTQRDIANGADNSIANPAVNSTGNGLNAQQNMVFQAVLSVKTEDGASLDFLCKRLSSMSKPTIKDILEFLNNEGHVYSTIDDDHFKATES